MGSGTLPAYLIPTVPRVLYATPPFRAHSVAPLEFTISRMCRAIFTPCIGAFTSRFSGFYRLAFPVALWSIRQPTNEHPHAVSTAICIPDPILHRLLSLPVPLYLDFTLFYSFPLLQRRGSV